MDPAIVGTMRVGYFRVGVFNDAFDRLAKSFESAFGTLDVTRRRLFLSSPRDSETGWYPKEYEETTLEMPLVPRASQHFALKAGTYVRTDALGFTCDAVAEGDEIQVTETGEYYEVKAVRRIPSFGDLRYRECDLTYLPLHNLTYSDAAPTVEDARYRTKDYWETYISLSNLNNHNFIVCYADPDYPLLKVFKTKGVHIIFAVAQPNSTPLLGHDRAAYGYEEYVPTHVLTLDTQLQWLAEAELRRVCETYPSGSQRSLERRGSHDRWLGSARLYDTEYILNYRRDLT